MPTCNEHVEYAGKIDVPAAAIQVIDPAVISKLPQGTEVKAISGHGASSWTRTARLDTELGGRETPYFLKTGFGQLGRNVMTSELISMSKLYAAMPDLVPRPIACGSYSTIPDVHFFLCQFRNMEDELPDIETFPAMMAELHRSTMSTNGMYGFGVPTYHGNTPIEHGWSATWEEYFERTTRALFELEQKAQGRNQEILDMMPVYLGKVVPRLLRPLETEGRAIKPSLIHGDLWHGNASMDRDTGRPVIFDGACFYAHNEYELAVWRQSWNSIGEPYRTRYEAYAGKSEPEEDYEDRAALYTSRVSLLDSILYKEEGGYRRELIAGMRALVQKFSGGYEGWLESRKQKA